MAATIDELTVNFFDDGRLVRRQLLKEVIAKGTWATVMYLLQELDRKTGAWGPPRVSIVRYKKSRGEYRFQSRFNVTGEKQAREVMSTLEKWFGAEGTPGVAAAAAKEADERAARGEGPTPAESGSRARRGAAAGDSAPDEAGADADAGGGNSDEPPDF